MSSSSALEPDKEPDSSQTSSTVDSSSNDTTSDINITNGSIHEVIVKGTIPLCADYRSGSDSENDDSESDSSTSLTSTSNGTSSEGETESGESHDSNTVKTKTEKNSKNNYKDLFLCDLPPIENLKISVPEDACIEIGIITGIVETLVVVESYKGTAALDIDTVLFLDCGRTTLGKVFDILGPITEPAYAVRFNSHEQIKDLNIKKDMKVYYAPKTEHTSFVFMSEVLKIRGSDASWKDNAEAPPEFQDFSDDEEERLHKNKQPKDTDGESPNSKEQNKSRKRSFNKVRLNSGGSQDGGFRNRAFFLQRPHFQRHPTPNQFVPPLSFPRTVFPGPGQIQQFPSYGGTPPSPCNTPPSAPRHYSPCPFPPWMSGPPFPTFGGLPLVSQSQNFQQPFYQQRSHPFSQVFGSWGRQMFRPPPPPPPPADQVDRPPGSEGHL